MTDPSKRHSPENLSSQDHQAEAAAGDAGSSLTAQGPEHSESVRKNSSSHPSQLTLKWPVSQGGTGFTCKSEWLSWRKGNAGVGREGEGQEETKPE